VFENFSLGVATNRDAWCYNYSKQKLISNISSFINFYNDEMDRFSNKFKGADKKTKENSVSGFISSDTTRISWTRGLKQELIKGSRLLFDASRITTSSYRPFTKQYFYFDRQLNEMVLQMPKLFPNSSSENLVIAVSGIGARSGFSALMTNKISDLQMMDNGQCFPFYIYDGGSEHDKSGASQEGDLFSSNEEDSFGKKCAITNESLDYFKAAYPEKNINKEDIFYYIYGMLHAPDYIERYRDNLSKELPRIPCVKSFDSFQKIMHAGKTLSQLHVNYEDAPLYPVEISGVNKAGTNFRVVKMRYGKSGKEKDLTTLHYNDEITVSGIPLEAYNYIVNGKAALDWVMERQSITTHKDSGLMNDANDWALETMHDPSYPLKLFQRVITVSLETMKIVNGLPKLDI